MHGLGLGIHPAMTMTRHLALCTAALFSLLATPILADDIPDAPQAALTACDAGDLAKTAEQMTLARQGLGAQQRAMLTALLPASPDGYTREDSADFTQSFGIMGGSAGAGATCSSADGSVSFKLSFVAYNPMVAAMRAIPGNAQMMAMLGKVIKVGDQALLSNDGSISTLVNARVLFQAQCGTEEQMLPLVQGIDFAKVGMFDKK